VHESSALGRSPNGARRHADSLFGAKLADSDTYTRSCGSSKGHAGVHRPRRLDFSAGRIRNERIHFDQRLEGTPSLSPGDNLGLGFVVAPPGMPLPDVVRVMKTTYIKMFGAGNPIASHAEKLCGGTSDGWYFENTITIGTFTAISEQTLIIGPSNMFEATYTRISSEKEDPAARSALDTLCVKPSPSPA
jgi:hypothetical protein